MQVVNASFRRFPDLYDLYTFTKVYRFYSFSFLDEDFLRSLLSPENKETLSKEIDDVLKWRNELVKIHPDRKYVCFSELEKVR